MQLGCKLFFFTAYYSKKGCKDREIMIEEEEKVLSQDCLEVVDDIRMVNQITVYVYTCENPMAFSISATASTQRSRTIHFSKKMVRSSPVFSDLIGIRKNND